MGPKPAFRRPRATTSNLHDGDATQTRERILDATFRRLVSEGYAALSVREIAKDAGVNHALINYHFRSKDQLVIEVLDEANQRLLARQAAMYESAGGFAQKWADARRFYEDDLASGFVRLQAELWAASLSNPGLREKFLPRLLAWKKLVLGAVREAHRGAAGRRHEAAAAVHARGHCLLDLGVLAWHGVRRPARREGRAGRSIVPRWTPCSGCSNRSTPEPRHVKERRSAPEEPPMNMPTRRCPSASTASWARCPSPARCRAADASPFDTVQPVREGFVERDGVKIWYAVWGDSGPWIAFAPTFQIVHSQMLKGMVPYLSQHFRVITMDGAATAAPIGRMGRPRTASTTSTRDFVAVLDAAGADRRGPGRHLGRRA